MLKIIKNQRKRKKYGKYLEYDKMIALHITISVVDAKIGK